MKLCRSGYQHAAQASFTIARDSLAGASSLYCGRFQGPSSMAGCLFDRTPCDKSRTHLPFPPVPLPDSQCEQGRQSIRKTRFDGLFIFEHGGNFDRPQWTLSQTIGLDFDQILLRR
jgi:hypothetical protein